MTEKFNRQSFLGEKSQDQIESTTIAVIGFGGGGSLIGQQLLHIGFKKIKIFDSDFVEESNTHRLVGINYPDDVKRAILKIEIAKRMAQAIQGETVIETYDKTWQECADEVKKCDIVIGSVDSFDQRDQLEVFCRRYNKPYVDIGMGVVISEGEAPQMGGQVILSLPGHPCMRCMDFITEDKLNDDRSDYGDAGPQPQVIWANGVLASMLVGIVVDLVTNWTRNPPKPLYLSYDANNYSVTTHPRLKYMKKCECPHYSNKDAGDPVFLDL